MHPRCGLHRRTSITVQTHHIAMVMAEQGFGPAIIDSFTALTKSFIAAFRKVADKR
jgi:hypothetical protein